VAVRSLLREYGGKHPGIIITDQDAAMKAAIEEMFPETKHINCLFHIKKKCYKKNLKCFASRRVRRYHRQQLDSRRV
jgi:transposase-like protein